MTSIDVVKVRMQAQVCPVDRALPCVDSMHTAGAADALRQILSA